MVRHAVCEIDSKYKSFSTDVALKAREADGMAATPGQVVMVTGGAGFLGQHIVKLLTERGDDVKEIRVFDMKNFHKKLGKNVLCSSYIYVRIYMPIYI